MEHQDWIIKVKDSIDQIIQGMEPQVLRNFAERILNAKQIFLMGSGRTGLVVEMFAMRLAQLGMPVFVVSYSTTPALEKSDLLILVSGSGETEPILSAASIANEIGAEIFVITQKEESSLGKWVQDTFIIPSPSKNTKVHNGTLFEMALLICLDAVVVELLNLTGQGFEDMSKRHANLG